MRDIDMKKLVAEAVGTALLVFFGAGVATLSAGGMTPPSTINV